MAKGKITLIQKDPKKRNYSKQLQTDNLPTTMMLKILTEQIRGEIYYLLTSRGLFPDEQKGHRKDPEAQQNYFT